MKKVISILCVTVLILGMCACGNIVTGVQDGISKEPGSSTVTSEMQNGTKEAPVAVDGLSMLAGDSYAHCNTEEGYYYITEKEICLKDGGYATHLMYIDFATQQEIYLCSDAGCSHDDESCGAVLKNDEFPWGSCKIFIWNGNLYILSKEYDSDGTVGIDMSMGAAGGYETEASQASLYRMNMDGTGRKRIYTFDDGLTLEDVIFAEGDCIYFVTKKLDTTVEGGTSVTSSTDRTLVCFTLGDGKLKEVLPLDFGDGVIWQVVGCYDRSLVLEGISYADGSNADATMSQDEWENVYSKSQSVFATLDLDSSVLNQVYHIQNTGVHSSANRDGFLYVSIESTGTIEKLDLRTGEKNNLASLKQTNICGMVGNKLICRTWDMTSDYTLYFVDTASGEVSHCGLVNKYNGWPLEVVGETKNNAIVVYDYKADAHADGSYEIYQYKIALLAKEDLYMGNGNYRPIQMIREGR